MIGPLETAREVARNKLLTTKLPVATTPFWQLHRPIFSHQINELSDLGSCQLATTSGSFGSLKSINKINAVGKLPSCQNFYPPTGGVRARLNGARTPARGGRVRATGPPS